LVWFLVATLVCGLFSLEGAKAQSFTNRFHARLAMGQRREEFVTSPFGGLRGLPLPYFYFLIIYFFAKKAERYKFSGVGFTQSSQWGKGAKALLLPPLGD